MILRQRDDTAGVTNAASAVLLVLLALACDPTNDLIADRGGADTAVVTPLSSIAGTAVPHSTSSSVALVDHETACTVDSFESMVRCVARDGTSVGVFGGEGEGPGEFERPGRLARGAGGTVGVMDPAAGRFQVFTPSGELVAGVGVEQSLWTPGSTFGADTIVGTFSAASMGPDVVSRFTRLLQAAAVSMSSGQTVRTWSPATLPEEGACEHRFYSFPVPSGEWVFVDCQGTISVVDDEGNVAGVRSPMWTGERPNERDLSVLVDRQRANWDFGNSLVAEGYAERGRPPPTLSGFVVDSAALEEYSQRPKTYYLLRGLETIDADGRVWIPTQVDRAGQSYIDVFSLAPDYLGTVRVVDRMIDFDVLDETLIVLVEGSDLERSRRIDWYEIPDDFGR